MREQSPTGQASNFDDALLVTVQRNLYALKNMLDKNPQLFSSVSSDQVGGVGNRQNHEHDAWKVENTSASHLHALLGRTIEAISFVLLLVDYHLGELVAQCDKETQTLVSNMTFEELITTAQGLHVSRALVNVIINRQIGQQISVSLSSESLHGRTFVYIVTDRLML